MNKMWQVLFRFTGLSSCTSRTPAAWADNKAQAFGRSRMTMMWPLRI